MNTFAAALSVHPVAAFAVGSVIGDVLEQIGTHPDLAVLIVTRHFAGALEDVVRTVQATLQPANLVGMTAHGVIANGTEIEEGPAMMLWAGATGPCSVELIRPGLAPEFAAADSHTTTVGGSRDGTSLLIGDANSFAENEWFRTLAGNMVGGFCKSRRNEPLVVVANGRLQLGGAALVRFADNVVRRSFVSVGTVGIGAMYRVTRSERSTLYELDGGPALDRLHAALRDIHDSERVLSKYGVHLGIAPGNWLNVDEAEPGETDRLDPMIPDLAWHTRRLLGMDRVHGALSVDGNVNEGDLVQFQLRSRLAASDDLERLVADHFGSTTVEGALCFVSESRGKEFFGDEHHDAKILYDAIRVPVAGLFCDAEVAVLGDQSIRLTDSCTVLTFSRPRR